VNPPPSLLEATFLHVQGVGRTTEQKLWQAGAHDWDTYLAQPDSRWPLTRAQRALLTPTILESKTKLAQEAFPWFAERLPAGEHWRAIPAFGHRLAFVDIETTGGMNPDDLTSVGIYNGYHLQQFVKGINLAEVPSALEDAAVIVTFFGTGFDMPFLRRSFPAMSLPQMHVDLCFLLKRLGYRGGLKQIETQLGIRRPQGTAGLSGWDAVRLWREYRRGRKSSLDTLLAYNADDVRNMAELLAIGYRRMAQRVLAGDP
jgi:uncharacterized protein YprB with RNaseH-like and TPR domain